MKKLIDLWMRTESIETNTIESVRDSFCPGPCPSLAEDCQKCWDREVNFNTWKEWQQFLQDCRGKMEVEYKGVIYVLKDPPHMKNDTQFEATARDNKGFEYLVRWRIKDNVNVDDLMMSLDHDATACDWDSPCMVIKGEEVL